MSYITAINKQGNILTWSRNATGMRVCNKTKTKYFCYFKDIEGDYKDLYGNSLSRKDFANKKEFQEFKNGYIKYGLDSVDSSVEIDHKSYIEICKQDDNSGDFRHKKYYQKTFLYESDIPPVIHHLSDNFYKAKVPQLYMSAYDIEVDYDIAYPNTTVLTIREVEDTEAVFEVTLQSFMQDLDMDVYEIYDESLNRFIPSLYSKYMFSGGFPRPVKDFNPEDYRGDFVKVEGTPYAPINAISIYNFWENKNYLISIPSCGMRAEDIDVEQFSKDIEDIEPLDLPTVLEFVDTESELLLRFLDIIEDSDLLFGWNSDTFDNPYIAQRILIALGENDFKRLSFSKAFDPKFTETTKFGEKVPTLETSGRVVTDYLEVYKKCTFTLQPSYKLESIAELELPKMRKLEYDGSLFELYRKDYARFIRYNIRDTEVLYGFEQKLGFLSLLNDMYHDFTGLFKNVFGTISSVDYSLLNYAHHEFGDIKVPDSFIENLGLDASGKPINMASFDGAYVLETNPGMYSNVASVDITSLYPKTIESNNISPEMIVGQFQNTKEDFQKIKSGSDDIIVFKFDTTHKDYPGQKLELSAKKWSNICIQSNWSISGYGTIFDLSTKGILPRLLSDWFDIRNAQKSSGFSAFHDAEKILEKYK